MLPQNKFDQWHTTFLNTCSHLSIPCCSEEIVEEMMMPAAVPEVEEATEVSSQGGYYYGGYYGGYYGDDHYTGGQVAAAGNGSLKGFGAEAPG